ncbi:paraquat-inducible protein A [Methylocucumis oryzae]|uniref:Paraquat-inducible protein A n=1 Tax=Methylocucumis oryzae TaxID=1632867 RepID=A0A0F3IH39_9GAMM|nr:paraquat-inducible protein A [Methylocucumis oryzae]KJV05863.1 paraquat-inducible protein A [Methylocucumis oryzae]
MKHKRSALSQGVVRCGECGLLANIIQPEHYCERCGAKLYARIPYSLQRTTALLLSSYALYFPANMFPIMTVTQLGVTQKHTILGGILSLVEKDMVPIAILVFIASIIVPLLKLIGITLLLVHVKLRWRRHAHLWAVLYRLIVLVGRWSMLDIFMISILIAVVDFGGVSEVIAGPAATAFAAVVVLTMLAAKSFDPRLLWDDGHL